MTLPVFFRLQLFSLGVALVVPAVCMILALFAVCDPLVLSDVAMPTLLMCWIVALMLPFLMKSNASKQTRWTAFILAWSLVAIIFPLSWDLPWAILHNWIYGATADDVTKWYFWAYGVADTRFLKSDPLMIILEYGSGVIGVLEILFLNAFLRNQLDRAAHLLVAAGSLQFYGCSVFFLSEAMQNLQDIRPDAISFIKFFGLNGMWMIIPAISGFLLLRLAKHADYSAEIAGRRLFGKG